MKVQSAKFKAQGKFKAPSLKLQPAAAHRLFGAFSFEFPLSFELCALNFSPDAPR
jgi:hypothetical protein